MRHLVAIAPLLLAAATGLGPAPAVADDGFDPAPAAISSPTSSVLVPIRRSEPRSELATMVGGAVVDQPQVHGLARAAFEVDGSWAPSREWELFATVNAAAYRWVEVAGRVDSRLAVGSATVGATWAPVALPRGRLSGGFFLRVLLPTSTEVAGAHAWGVQPGFTFRGVVTRWLAWYGGGSFRVAQGWGPIPATTRTGSSATAGVAFVPADWLRFALQASGNFPFDSTPNQFSPAAGVRFVQGKFSADLGVVLSRGAALHPLSFMGRMAWNLGE